MLPRKSYYQIYDRLKVKRAFHENVFQKKKYCYEFITGIFQMICVSMVGENRHLLASIETPAQLQFA